jgi:hypothetical protein
MKMRFTLFLAMAIAVIAASSSCSAKSSNDKNKTDMITETDSIMQKAVGDSIYRVITKAKKIEVASLSLASDSTQQEVTKRIPSKEFSIVNFIVTNPKNYLSNKPVYGVFMPQFQATYTLKKEVLSLRYDFGLRKWGVFDANGKEVAMFDLASDNMLRLACKYFPDNKFFYEVLMTRED